MADPISVILAKKMKGNTGGAFGRGTYTRPFFRKYKPRPKWIWARD
jgi:hypothetical protein